MASSRILHVVCLFGLILLRAWRAEGQASAEFFCSEHLGANKLSSLQPPVKGTEPQICVSNMTCCTRETEENLRIRAAKETKTHLRTKYTAAKSSLLSIFDDLRNYFQNVIREGDRQSSLFILNTQKKNLTTDEVQVLSTFFKHLENYLVDDTMQLEDIVNTFFRDSFPLVLEHAIERGVSNLYKQCLKTNMESIQPFGNRPAQLVGIFEEVFEPVRKLLSSFKFAIEVMNMAQQFNFSSGCKNLLLEMKFCSLCQGLHRVKPCYGYCNDALKECLIAEIKLQSLWGSYIDNIYSLTHSIGMSDLENFSNSIYKDLWEAAMHVLLQKDNIMAQVRNKCGIPVLIDAPSEMSYSTNSVPPTPHVKVRLFAKMEEGGTKVSTLKSFYRDLPDELCVADELSVKQVNFGNCWNGKSLERYTGLDSVTADFEMTSQAWNHLKLMAEKIRDKKGEIQRLIVHSMGDDGESASGSGEGSEYGSACGDDDEDCGSSSGSGVKNEITDITVDENSDLYLEFTTTQSSNVVDNILAGGVPTTKRKHGNMLARGNASSTYLTFALPYLALLMFAILPQNG